MRNNIHVGAIPPNTFPMERLGRGKLAIIRHGSNFVGDIVMRVPTSDRFEVMNLSKLTNGAWDATGAIGIEVEILPDNHKVVLEVWND